MQNDACHLISSGFFNLKVLKLKYLTQNIILQQNSSYFCGVTNKKEGALKSRKYCDDCSWLSPWLYM